MPYQTKNELLNEFLRLNEGMELPFDNVADNYEWLKLSFPEDSKGNTIDWDAKVEEPSALLLLPLAFGRTIQELSGNIQEAGHDVMSEILGVLPGETNYYASLGAQDTADRISKLNDEWRDGLENHPMYGPLVTYEKENPYGLNKWSAKQNAIMFGDGVASMLTGLTTAAGAGAFVSLSGATGGLATLATGLGYFAGTAVSEGSSAYASMVDFYGQDKQVSEEQFNSHLNLFKESDDYKALPNFTLKKRAEAKFIADNYKVDKENGIYTKLGLSTDEVKDAALLTGLTYGAASAGLEYIGGRKLEQMFGILPKGAGLGIRGGLQNSIRAYWADKLVTKMSFIPKTRSKLGGWKNRLFADKIDESGAVPKLKMAGLWDFSPIKPSNISKTLYAMTQEGATEMAQLVTEKFLANNMPKLLGQEARNDDVFNAADLMHSFHAGALLPFGLANIKGTVGFVDHLTKDTKVSKAIKSPYYSLKNQVNLRRKLADSEQLFYYKQLDDGTFAIGTRAQIKDEEVGGILEEGELDPERGLFSRVKTKAEAQVMVQKINRAIKEEAIGRMLVSNQHLVDGQVAMAKVGPNEFKVEILDKDGKVIDTAVYDNRRDARKAKNTTQKSINHINKIKDDNPNIANNLPDKPQESSKSDAMLVLEDTIGINTYDSNSQEGQRLNAILPSDPKENTKRRLEQIANLKESDVLDYINQLPEDEDYTIDELKEQLLQDASDNNIPVDPDALFLDEGAIPEDIDTQIDEQIVDEDDQISMLDLQDETIYPDVTGEPVIEEDIPAPPPSIIEDPTIEEDVADRPKLDIDKPVNVKEFLPQKDGGNIEAYSTQELESLLENVDGIYTSFDLTRVRSRVQKELDKRYIEDIPDEDVPTITKEETEEQQKKDERKSIEAEESHDNIIAKMEKIVSKKTEDLTDDDLSSVRDFKEIFEGSKDKQDVKVLKEIERIESEIAVDEKEKTVVEGDVVEYKGKPYILWKVNTSGKAQLIKPDGKKFSGTPNVDKLKFLKELPKVEHDGFNYIVDKDGRIFSLSTGLEVYKDDSKIRTDILNEADMLPEVTEEVIEEATDDWVVENMYLTDFAKETLTKEEYDELKEEIDEFNFFDKAGFELQNLPDSENMLSLEKFNTMTAEEVNDFFGEYLQNPTIEEAISLFKKLTSDLRVQVVKQTKQYIEELEYKLKQRHGINPFDKDIDDFFVYENELVEETTTVTKSGVVHVKGITDEKLDGMADSIEQLVDEHSGTITQKKGHQVLWYGPLDYEYPGPGGKPITHGSKPMPDSIRELKNKVEDTLGKERDYFDSVLINVYEVGVSLAPHQDNESILQLDDGTIGSVATVSLGASTNVTISNKEGFKETILVEDGDIYELPEGKFQYDKDTGFYHGVEPATEGMRISISFRKTNAKVAPPEINTDVQFGAPEENLEIYDMREEKLIYSRDQKKALELASDFLQGDKLVLKIAGYAGTGKTTIIENIAKFAEKNSKGLVYLTAFTNKAVLNLENKTNTEHVAETKTLHSLLYGAPNEQGQFEKGEPLNEGDVVIVDEASMVGIRMMKDIKEQILDKKAKIIFIGDSFQLPPVDDKPIFDTSNFELTTVHRQGLDSPVLSLATAIRMTESIIIPNENSEDGSFKLSNNALNEYLNDIKNPDIVDDIMYVVDTNPRRVQINRAAREARYGDSTLRLKQNDKVVYIANGIHKNGQTAIVNNMDYITTFIAIYLEKIWSKEKNPVTGKREIIRIDEVKIKVEHYQNSKGEDFFLVPNHGGPSLYHAELVSKYFEDYFSTIVDDFNDIGMQRVQLSDGSYVYSAPPNVSDIATYGYAITAHKAQGSEWSKVYVERSWVNNKKNEKNWIYTAITRSKKEVVFQTNPKFKNIKSWEEINNLSSEALDSEQVRLSISEGFTDLDPMLDREAVEDLSYFLKNVFVDENGTPIFNVEIDKYKGAKWDGKYTASEKLIQFNLERITRDTVFHEFWHPFIAELRVKNPRLWESLFRELYTISPEVAKNIEKTVRKNYADKPGYESELVIREEILVTALGIVAREVYVDKQKQIANRTAFQKMKAFVEKVMKAIKEFVFGPTYIKVDNLSATTTLEQLGEMINSGNKIQLDSSSLAENIEIAGSQIQLLSITSPNSVLAMQTRRILNASWRMADRHYKRKNKQLSPYDFRDLIREITKNEDVLDIVNDWFYTKFENHPLVKEMEEGRDSLEKTNAKFINELFEWDPKGEGSFGEGIREGLALILPEETDWSGITTNEIQFLRRLNIIASKEEIDFITALGYNTPDFDSFSQEIHRKFPNLFNTAKDEANLLSYWLLKQNSIRTHRNKVAENDRVNWSYIKTKYKGDASVEPSLVIMGETSPDGTKNNPQQDRNTLLEVNVGYNIVSYLNFSDSQTEVIHLDSLDLSGNPISVWNEDFIFEPPSKDLLFARRKALIGTRGDSPKLLLADIKDEHIQAAKHLLNLGKDNVKKTGYWKRQMDKGLVPKDGVDVDNFTEDFTLEGLASEIAVHETIIQMYPQYLSDSLENVIKRIKIPTTPVTVSPLMEDFTLSQFDPNKATFVVGDKVTPSILNIPGVDSKNIGDGGTLTSKRMFRNFRKAFGIRPSISTAKTAIYGLDREGTSPSENDGVVMVKHLQYKPPVGTKIYYDHGTPNERLFAEVKDDGNIYIYDKDGKPQYVDMLLTPDEAKILEGSYKQEMKDNGFIELSGQNIGFIKSHDKVPKFSKHLSQIYNHTNDIRVINSFEYNIMAVVEKNLRTKMSRLFIQSNRNNVVDRIQHEYAKYDTQDREAYFETAVELSKLGAGLHPSMLPSLKQIIKNNIIAPNLELSKMDGTKADVIPNLEGDLQENEIAISVDNASIIVQKVFASLGMKTQKQKQSLTGNRAKLIKEVNKYLEENPTYVFVARSPIPHVGGALMARVKRVHGFENQVLVNPIDLFAKLEGDSDGDTVFIEFLNESMTRTYKEYFDNLNVEGISLQALKEKIPGKKLRFSKRADRMKVTREMVTGSKAIGEIANIQTIYGILNNTVDSIMINGQEIFIRNPEDIIQLGMVKGDLATVFRTVLQAAVDNGKFMMIKTIGYDVDMNGNSARIAMMLKMFKNQDGSDINMETGLSLISLFNLPQLFGKVNAITQLGDFNGAYNLDQLYELSGRFNAFAMNKDNAFLEIAAENEVNAAIQFKKNPDGSYVMHPKEHLAAVLDNTKQAHEVARNTTSQEIGPWDINRDLHKNTHMDSMDILNKEHLNRLIKDAMGRDGNTSASHVNQARKDALKYAGEIIADLRNFTETKDNLVQIDRNDLFNSIKEKYHVKFAELSETAKVLATMYYLGDGTLKDAALATTIIPPSSTNKNKFNNLDHRVLKAYFKEYNKIINNPNSRNFSPQMRTVIARDFSRLLREVCSV